MFIAMKSRLSSKLVHVGSQTRSRGQTVQKPCVHSRGHRVDPKFKKLCQNVNSYGILIKFETVSC